MRWFVRCEHPRGSYVTSHKTRIGVSSTGGVTVSLSDGFDKQFLSGPVPHADWEYMSAAKEVSCTQPMERTQGGTGLCRRKVRPLCGSHQPLLGTIVVLKQPLYHPVSPLVL